MVFDAKTIEEIGWYVYCLVDPEGRPFYIGKGKGNRVFAHVNDALGEEATASDKIDKIREILAEGKTIDHYIIRHAIKDEQTAYMIESVLIDVGQKFSSYGLKNAVRGLDSVLFGISSTKELIMKYQATPLDHLQNDAMIVNINRKYNEGEDCYEAAKEAWLMGEKRTASIKYVLAEYRGFIVEVFEVKPSGWYKVPDHDGKRQRWGFKGYVAPSNIRNIYINKRIIKMKGARAAVRYNL